MANKQMRFEETYRGYLNLFSRMWINSAQYEASEACSERIYANRETYRQVEAVTGVPWFWVGIIHAMESSNDFSTHLHNGDSLTARTVRVPMNRPVLGSPPFTWIESAIDAVRLKQLDDVKDWSLARCLYEFERYNGFGYFSRGVNSPYLWSYSDLYKRGKYSSDGVFDAEMTSAQPGAAVLLKMMGDKGMLEGWPRGENAAVPDRPTQKPVTKIDQVLGGEWLAGKKTIIGIVVYVAVHLVDQADLFPLFTNDIVMSYFDTVITGWLGLSAISKAEKWLSMIKDTLGAKTSQI